MATVGNAGTAAIGVTEGKRREPGDFDRDDHRLWRGGLFYWPLVWNAGNDCGCGGFFCRSRRALGARGP
jgi:hypothetical protein